ncbi:methyltransferase [Klebsiella variicola]|nr:methyltransferase [Klebsiella variicola]
MLCSWARDHQIVGTGVDMSLLFSQQATARAEALGVSDRVTFVHQDASGYVASQPCDIAACVGATWIGGGVAGTIALLKQSLRPGGMLLIGEPMVAVNVRPRRKRRLPAARRLPMTS